MVARSKVRGEATLIPWAETLLSPPHAIHHQDEASALELDQLEPPLNKLKTQNMKHDVRNDVNQGMELSV